MIIIPARLASTRFKEKILCDINGEPMFVATAKNALKVSDDVVVACDDESVEKIAKKHGIKAVMTSKEHESGSDRINEACASLGLRDDEIVINIQADEPFFELENLTKFMGFARSSIKNGAFMASCFKGIDFKSASDPNIVKVVLDSNLNALYFSRSIIPYARDERELTSREYFGHIGIYAYKTNVLKEVTQLPISSLEKAESLEQLRWLQNGYCIKVGTTNIETIGIDTPADLQQAEQFLSRQ